MDSGATWNVLDFPTSLKDGWGEGTAVWPIDSTHWLFEDWELYYTSDAGKNWQLLDTDGYLAIQGPFYKSETGTFIMASANGVIMSADGTKNWKKVPNSGGPFDGVTGCGDNLFAVVGFQPPSAAEVLWSASKTAPDKWMPVPADGLPSKVSSGGNWVDCDKDHKIVYSALQGAGLWRMVTSGADQAPSGGAGGTAGNDGGGRNGGMGGGGMGGGGAGAQ
jgi:hypothetical protein